MAEEPLRPAPPDSRAKTSKTHRHHRNPAQTLARVNASVIPSQWGCTEFLAGYPEMTLEPAGNESIRLTGSFRFLASRLGEAGSLEDQFQVVIEVPQIFPREIPAVFETGGRIPRLPQYHVNSDGSLCLGSPIHLLLIAAKHPTLLGFVDHILVPFLLAISTSLATGQAFLFGELAHGVPGALADYQELFQLKTPDQAKLALHALTLRKRLANKLSCPCGCGLRLGKCRLRLKLNPLRIAASRAWFGRQLLHANGAKPQSLRTAQSS